MKILCVQISTNLINGKPNLKDISQRYYNKLYKIKTDYNKPLHFWEIPLWITEIDFNVKTDFHVCTNIKDTINFIKDSNYTHICFSVLAVNSEIIKYIIKEITQDIKNTKKFIIGGYTDLVYFKNLNNTHIFNTIRDFIESLDIKYKQGNSYRLFTGYSVIPRLTLSNGCLNNCNFCTVKNKIVKINTHVVEQQINAFKYLKFKLIYINDKTFGQCSNYKLLLRIYKAVKEYNREFKGFIIQTTTAQLLKLSNVFIYNAHIKYIELGIESYNNNILKECNKPSSEILSIKAFKKVRKLLHVRVIPNIIIGLPKENSFTYKRTLNFLKSYKDIISHLNIYNFAIYNNTEIAKNIKPSNDNNNELRVNTSKQYHIDFYNNIYKFGIDILNGCGKK